MAWWNNGSALANSVVSRWNLDEASGNAVDSVGSNTLTDTNTVGSAAGYVLSTARLFDFSASERFRITDNSSVSVGDIQFWFAAWVKIDDKTAVRNIASHYNNTTNKRAWRLFYDNVGDRFNFGVSADGGATVTLATANNFGAITAGVWYLVVAWHDSVANTVNISINGQTPDSTAHTTGVFNSDEEFMIGAQGTTSAGTPGFFWDGQISAATFGKGVALTTDDLFTIFREGPVITPQWHRGNAQIDSADVLEHVEVPTVGQLYAGSAVASGQPWSIAVKTRSFAVSASGHYLFDTQTGRVALTIHDATHYGVRTGSNYSNTALFPDTATHIWFLVSDGANIQAYLDNVAVGTAISSNLGLANTSSNTRWGSAFDSATNLPWTNPIIYGAVYNKALDENERKGLYFAMLDTNIGTDIVTATGTWVAPDGISLVDVIAWGPGGNGGTGVSNSAGGGGGGGGARAATTDVVVTPGASYSVTVGTGGSQTSTTFPGDAENVIADAGNNSSGSAAGTAGSSASSTGDTKTSGGGGGAGNVSVNGNGGGGGGGSGNTGAGGGSGSAGGAGLNGGGNGGNGGRFTGPVQPVAGSIPGGGGGGGHNSSGGSKNGAAGARGQITISWTYPEVSSLIDIEGSSAGSSTVDGVLKGAGGVDVTIAGTSTAVGDIAGKILISSATAGTSTVAGILKAAGNVRSVIAGTSTTTAIIRAKGTLSAALVGTSDVPTSHLSNAKTLRATSAGSSTVVGIIKAKGKLISATTGSSTVVPHLIARPRISTSIAGSATVVGLLKLGGYIFGNSQGTTVIISAIMALGRLRTTTHGSSTMIGVLNAAEGHGAEDGFKGIQRAFFKGMR